MPDGTALSPARVGAGMLLPAGAGIGIGVGVGAGVGAGGGGGAGAGFGVAPGRVVGKKTLMMGFLPLLVLVLMLILLTPANAAPAATIAPAMVIAFLTAIT